MRHRSGPAIVLMTVMLALAACGGSDGGDPEPKASKAAASAGGGSRGEVTFTAFGTTQKLAADTCDRTALTGDKVLYVKAGELYVSLPPTPGDFADRDAGVLVMLPDPGNGAVYANSRDAHGTWSKSGDHVEGHLEGKASAIGNADDATFTIDFSCTYQEIS